MNDDSTTRSTTVETFAPVFDTRGLIPVVVMDNTTHELLMVAFMNQEALEKTRATKIAHFFSRSKNRLWKKGETSGNTLAVQSIRVDCDQDCVALMVDMCGSGTCHTGARSCFYREVKDDDTLQ